MGEGDIRYKRAIKTLLKKGLSPGEIKSLSRNTLFSYLFSEGFSLLECSGLYSYISRLSEKDIEELD